MVVVRLCTTCGMVVVFNCERFGLVVGAAVSCCDFGGWCWLCFGFGVGLLLNASFWFRF